MPFRSPFPETNVIPSWLLQLIPILGVTAGRVLLLRPHHRTRKSTTTATLSLAIVYRWRRWEIAIMADDRSADGRSSWAAGAGSTYILQTSAATQRGTG